MATGATDSFAPVDTAGLEDLQVIFPELGIDNDQGFGGSGANHSAKRTRNACARDFPSLDPDFYYAPMSKFGPGEEDCRATGAVAWITEESLREGLRLDPKWDPAGWDHVKTVSPNNQARLHLIANVLGGHNHTLRNFVSGYQLDANSVHMWDLEEDVLNAVKSGQSVTYGVVPVYGDSGHPGVPSDILIRARGSEGFRLDCNVRNFPRGDVRAGMSCKGGD
ncbi:hypothetical protein EBF04_23980 [Streptomyces sp. I6]|nr:hypothetical protein EBF04_23980 [Streptomyces sp. I6]